MHEESKILEAAPAIRKEGIAVMSTPPPLFVFFVFFLWGVVAVVVAVFLFIFAPVKDAVNRLTCERMLMYAWFHTNDATAFRRHGLKDHLLPYGLARLYPIRFIQPHLQ